MVYLFLFSFFLVSASEGDGEFKRSKTTSCLASRVAAAPGPLGTVVCQKGPDGTAFVSQGGPLKWKQDKKGNYWLLETISFDCNNNARISFPNGSSGLIARCNLPFGLKKTSLSFSTGPIHLFHVDGQWHQVISVSGQDLYFESNVKPVLRGSTTIHRLPGGMSAQLEEAMKED